MPRHHRREITPWAEVATPTCQRTPNQMLLPFPTSDGLGSNQVYRVVVSGSNIYAAANGGGLAVFTNSGNSWSAKTTSDGLSTNSTSGVTILGSTVYLATSAGVSYTSNNGSSWVNKTTSDGIGTYSVGDVFASGTNVYAAVACTDGDCTNGGISISSDGGNTWVHKTIGVDLRLLRVNEWHSYDEDRARQYPPCRFGRVSPHHE